MLLRTVPLTLPGSQKKPEEGISRRVQAEPYLSFAAGLHVVAHQVDEVPHGRNHAAASKKGSRSGCDTMQERPRRNREGGGNTVLRRPL